MIIETMGVLSPTTEVPDDDVDAETLLAWTSDRRWRSWTCPGCGCTSAGYHLPHDLALCAGCVQRRREGKELLSAAEVWQEVKAAGSSRPGRARISVRELEHAGAVFREALDADVEMVADADGSLRPARCAVCREVIRGGGGGRFGSTFYCSAHDWRRSA